MHRPWTSLFSALIAIVLVLLTPACAKKTMPSYDMSESYGSAGMVDEDDGADMEIAVQSARSRSAPAPRRSAAPAAPTPPPAQQDMAPPAEVAPPQDPAPSVKAPSRMVHYSGWARLRVAKVEDATDRVVAIAQAAGGEVERVGGTVVTVRVPVASFRAVFAELLAEIGDVLDKTISAQDVTEAFHSLELRAQTATKTRDQLIKLLARSTDEQEKLALMREIQRVTEDLDRMEAQLRTLSRLASMSRITLELVPRQAQAWTGGQETTGELAWLRALTPFRPDVVSEQGKKLNLALPAGMVQLTPKQQFIAESADGARLWSGRLPNEPVGNAAFWAKALQTRMAPEFASAEITDVGAFKVLTLVDRSDEPYTWVIAVKADGRQLHIVEAYFPTPTHATRYREAVLQTLRAAGGAA